MKTAVICSCAMVLAGCGFIDEMKGMMEKGPVVAKAIKDRHGWNAQVGGHMANGKLLVVTVMLNSKEVRDNRVAALEDAVTEVVVREFNGRPETLLLQIASGRLEN